MDFTLLGLNLYPFEVSANIIAFPCVKFQNRIVCICMPYYFLIYKHNTKQLNLVEGRVAQKAYWFIM